MKGSKHRKLWLLAAVSMILLGWIICLFVLWRVDFQWNLLMADKNGTEQIFPVDQAVLDIQANVKHGSVSIQQTDERFPKVVAKLYGRDACTVNVKDSVLIVRSKEAESVPWYEQIWYNKSSEITICLPKQAYDSLRVTALSADTTVSDSITFTEASVQTDSGEILFKADVKEKLLLTSSSGDMQISGKFSTAEATGNSGEIMFADCGAERISVMTTSGNVFISETICTGDVDITTDSGDVWFGSSSAKTLNIETDSGDVFGSTADAMQYSVQTDSGSVQVPPSGGDTRCIVRTNSGNVEFVQKSETER